MKEVAVHAATTATGSPAGCVGYRPTQTTSTRDRPEPYARPAPVPALRTQVEREMDQIQAALDRPGPEPSPEELWYLQARIEALRPQIEPQGDPSSGNQLCRSRSGTRASGSGRREYRTVSIDWTEQNLGAARKAVYGSEPRRMLLVEQVVMYHLQPLFADGWELAGPHDTAIQYIYKEAGRWLYMRSPLWKVVIRLRRGVAAR